MNELEKQLEKAFWLLNLRIDQSRWNLNSHQIARLVFYGLKKLGYETVKVVDGIYILSIEEAKDKTR